MDEDLYQLLAYQPTTNHRDAASMDINQLTKPPTNQPTTNHRDAASMDANQPTKPPINQPTNHPPPAGMPPAWTPINQTTNQPTNHQPQECRQHGHGFRQDGKNPAGLCCGS